MAMLNLLLAFLMAFLPMELGGSPDEQGGEGDKKKEGENPPPSDSSGTGNSGTKTLTQAEVDAIVRDRVARERQKYSNYDELRQKAEKYYQLE